MATPKKKGKRKVRRSVPVGVAHIQATFNNTIITITDPDGNTLA
ncbi:MAG: 30S ribosomal protein S11, partial [Deltaproteobacteria bacterium RIFOXYB2_FULL_66_7]